jgi:hypothetical protein
MDKLRVRHGRTLRPAQRRAQVNASRFMRRGIAPGSRYREIVVWQMEVGQRSDWMFSVAMSVHDRIFVEFPELRCP